MTITDTALDALTGPAEADSLASLSFDTIPGAARVWTVPGILAEGEVTVDAGTGETAKSMRNGMFAARLALGVPQPGHPHGHRPDCGRTLWVSSGTEDDAIFDLAPRFASALAACAVEFELDAQQAQAGSRYIHNLSEWADGGPIEITDDGLARIRAEVDRLNQLDASNRPPVLPDGSPDPAWDGPGPPVRLVVFDPLDALLGAGQTIDSRPGARRVMTGLSRFARGSEAAVSVIHHVIGSGGKIAGSPAVTNSVRLAFISAPDKGNATVKVMRRFKANISTPDDLRYVVATLPAEAAGQFEPAGIVPAPFVAFQGDAQAAASAGDTLRDRVAGQQEQVTLRDRLRQAAGQRPAAAADGDAGSVTTGEPGWRVLRRVMTADGTPGAATRVGSVFPDAEQARQAAQLDADVPLTWRTDDHGRFVAGVADPSGAGRHVVYAAYPGGA